VAETIQSLSLLQLLQNAAGKPVKSLLVGDARCILLNLSPFVL